MRENHLYETSKAISSLHENSVVNTIQEKVNRKILENKKLRESIESLKDRRYNVRETRADRYDRAVTEMLSVALKSIYVTALSENMLLESNTALLAESLVDNYIAEHGAFQILENMKNKTYLLDTVKRIVEDAAEEATDKEAPLEGEEPAEEEDTVDDNNLPVVSDETKEKMFDKLEKEEDIETAVEIIAQRISSAEEEFIKKNIEDKQKIEKIVNDINSRVQAVKASVNSTEEDKQQVEQECALESTRRINEVQSGRPISVLESIIRKLSSDIVTDTGLHEHYYENGKLNMDSVVEAAKCMYGFLEFVNTIQLERVDEEYIKKVVEEL